MSNLAAKLSKDNVYVIAIVEDENINFMMMPVYYSENIKIAKLFDSLDKAKLYRDSCFDRNVLWPSILHIQIIE